MHPCSSASSKETAATAAPPTQAAAPAAGAHCVPSCTSGNPHSFSSSLTRASRTARLPQQRIRRARGSIAPAVVVAPCHALQRHPSGRVGRCVVQQGRQAMAAAPCAWGRPPGRVGRHVIQQGLQATAELRCFEARSVHLLQLAEQRVGLTHLLVALASRTPEALLQLLHEMLARRGLGDSVEAAVSGFVEREGVRCAEAARWVRWGGAGGQQETRGLGRATAQYAVLKLGAYVCAARPGPEFHCPKAGLRWGRRQAQCDRSPVWQQRGVTTARHNHPRAPRASLPAARCAAAPSLSA
eukprot:229897-Chlamydomonas_euryale.AAC.21